MVKYMEKQKYKELTKRFSPKENKIKNMIMAFIIGGLIGLFGQILITVYSSIGNISKDEASSLMIGYYNFFIMLIYWTWIF